MSEEEAIHRAGEDTITTPKERTGETSTGYRRNQRELDRLRNATITTTKKNNGESPPIAPQSAIRSIQLIRKNESIQQRKEHIKKTLSC
jgi:hypothetical protein